MQRLRLAAHWEMPSRRACLSIYTRLARSESFAHTFPGQLVREPRHNKVTGANAGERLGLARKSQVGLRHCPGVAQFWRSPQK